MKKYWVEHTQVPQRQSLELTLCPEINHIDVNTSK